MGLLLDSLSNREIAITIWFSIFLVWVLTNKDVRKSFLELFKAIFVTQIIFPITILIFYVGVLVWALQKFNFWEPAHIKSTVFWLFGAIILFFNNFKAKTSRYFSEIIKDSFKLAIVIDYVFNFYVFSLPVELAFVPVLFLVVTTQAYSQTKEEEKYILTGKILSRVMGIFGIIIFTFTIYKTITNFEPLINIFSLKDLLLPLFLTIALVPLLYLVALYSSYDSLFTRLNSVLKPNSKEFGLLKKKIYRVTGLSLDRLNRLNSEINKPLFLGEGTLDDFFVKFDKSPLKLKNQSTNQPEK